MSSYPITVTVDTHCPHHTKDFLRSKHIKWMPRKTGPLILPKVCACNNTTINFSNYISSLNKSLGKYL